MQNNRNQRNWSQYNQKLQKIARIEFYISEEVISKWHYCGKRSPGGKTIYSNSTIELCLILREYYQLAYRQTQGFTESIFAMMNINLLIPDYTTMSRRASTLKVSIRNKLAKHNNSKEAIIVAIDSTGLSLYSSTDWNRIKHDQNKKPGHTKWRKLHIVIDVKTGEILDNKYTQSTANDGPELPGMLDSINTPISAVCGDMAYDTLNCRKAIKLRKARQLIPPTRRARISSDNRNIAKYKEFLEERDEAIRYIKHHTMNDNKSQARKSWKDKTGYHARSLVETTMFQIKSHCSDRLTNKNEQARATQAAIKCKIINCITAA